MRGPGEMGEQGPTPLLRQERIPRSQVFYRQEGEGTMGTYQAKTRGQEEPGDLHQGPWPVANHVLNVVIETVCP